MIGYQRPVLSNIASNALEASTNQSVCRIPHRTTAATTARGHRQGFFLGRNQGRGSLN